MTAVVGMMRRRRTLVLGVGALVVFPFVVAFLLDGAGPSAVIGNAEGNSRFLQGLVIEIFILALYALSYDLLLGVTGVLSFGHAMFFAVGAYTFGIALRTFDLGLGAALMLVVLAAILQALLFAVLLPRVKGIGYALVTLGLASMFWIVVQSSDLQAWTGAEIGLQGVSAPVSFLDTTNNRFVFYLVTLAVVTLVYLAYMRLVDSPAGRVLWAIRENEGRAAMLGFSTLRFKTLALVASSLTAALAGVIHALHQPIITPNVASLGWMVTALLVILIGGLGTISGALVGAAIFRLLQFSLDRWFGGVSDLLLGLAYVVIVLYLPQGVVGTWRVRRWERRVASAAPSLREGERRP